MIDYGTDNPVSRWITDAKNGESLESLIARFPIEVGDDIDQLPFYLGVTADRWADVKRLCNHHNPEIAENAQLEIRLHEDSVHHRAINDQRRAALPGAFQDIDRILQQIWWIAEIYYPWKSINYPQSNCCIMGDGFGMAYFKVDGSQPESPIALIKCNDGELNAVLSQHGIVPNWETRLSQLIPALEEFKERVNSRVSDAVKGDR